VLAYAQVAILDTGGVGYNVEVGIDGEGGLAGKQGFVGRGEPFVVCGDPFWCCDGTAPVAEALGLCTRDDMSGRRASDCEGGDTGQEEHGSLEVTLRCSRGILYGRIWKNGG